MCFGHKDDFVNGHRAIYQNEVMSQNDVMLLESRIVGPRLDNHFSHDILLILEG
jgi:hypothetical protein